MSRPVDQAPKAEYILLTTANSNDRFKLLEDDAVLKPNITNPIHPMFAKVNWQNIDAKTYERLDLTLRLASNFIKYDSVLEWFVAPLMGLPLLDSESGNSYLSDPLASKSRRTKAALIDRVRKAFDCLSHSMRFYFVVGECRFYARTVKSIGSGPVHDATCTQHFTCKQYLRLDICPQFLEYLQQHYDSDTLCGRLRYAFLFAATLVHELAHALGIMRRNDLVEPYVRLDHSECTTREFGYAWENFMFGCIINPFDRRSNKPTELMRKIWSDNPELQEKYGREWAGVPMSYIAQWFQKGTWELIQSKGPEAIAVPRARLKIRAVRPGERGGTILSDNREAIRDVKSLQRKIYKEWKGSKRESWPKHVEAILHIVAKHAAREELQEYTFTPPVRLSNSFFTGKRSGAKSGKAIGELMIRSYSIPPRASSTFAPTATIRSAFFARPTALKSDPKTTDIKSGRKRGLGEVEDVGDVAPTAIDIERFVKRLRLQYC